MNTQPTNHIAEFLRLLQNSDSVIARITHDLLIVAAQFAWLFMIVWLINL